MSSESNSYAPSNTTTLAASQSGRAYMSSPNEQYYSVDYAREAFHKSSFPKTLGNLLASEDLQRAVTIAEESEVQSLSREEQSRMLVRLDKSLSTVQEIEQSAIINPSHRRDFIEAAEGDFKIIEYKKAAQDALLKIEQLVSKTCTGQASQVCLDELCGLVARLSIQLNARIRIKDAFHDPSHQDADRQNTSMHVKTPLLSDRGDRRRSSQVDEAEYVHATQDFWRLAAVLLKDALVTETSVNSDLSSIFPKLQILPVIIAICAMMVFAVVISMQAVNDSPGSDTFLPIVLFVCAFMGIAVAILFTAVAQCCPYETEEELAGASTNPSGVFWRSNTVDNTTVIDQSMSIPHSKSGHGHKIPHQHHHHHHHHSQSGHHSHSMHHTTHHTEPAHHVDVSHHTV